MTQNNTKPVVVFGNDTTAIEGLKTHLSQRQFELHFCEKETELEASIHEKLPYIIFVLLTDENKDLAFSAIEKLKDKFVYLPFFIVSVSQKEECLWKSVELGIKFFVIYPFEESTFNEKLDLFTQKFSTGPSISFKAQSEEDAIGGKLQVDGVLSGLCQDGLAFSTQLVFPASLLGVSVNCEQLNELGMKSPRLKIMGTGREADESIGYAFKVFCQAVAWSEAERKKINQFVLENTKKNDG